MTEYLRFASEEAAKTVDFLCEAAKSAVEHKQITGAFYGYTAEVADSLWGTHALAKILSSPNIDFISSPNSYMDSRKLGVDWPDMLPVDSVSLHSKMCFMECDIRTFLTQSPGDSRSGSDPHHYYNANVWKGPETDELSVYAVRKSLAKQLTHKHGLWWFDMFGHWYCTKALMNEMKSSLRLYNVSITQSTVEYPAEVAVILDENSYSRMGKTHPAYMSSYNIRRSLGYTGVPYKFYLSSDFEQIDWENSSFKAVVLGITFDSDFRNKACERLKKCNISHICISKEKPIYTANELISFFKKAGVFIFSESLDVLYFGNGFVSLHAVTQGKKEIHLPQKLTCTDTQSGLSIKTDILSFNCKQYETRLFVLDKQQ